MSAESDEGRTVRLDLEEFYREAVQLVGQEEADRLWSEHRLDTDEKWPGKWAKAMELIEMMRAQSDGD